VISEQKLTGQQLLTACMHTKHSHMHITLCGHGLCTGTDKDLSLWWSPSSQQQQHSFY